MKDGFERIVLTYDERCGTRKIAFNGKWLYSTNDYDSREIWEQSVAITENERLLVYHYNTDSSLGYYEVYDSFELFAEDENIFEEIKAGVAEEIGEDYVEFLDI